MLVLFLHSCFIWYSGVSVDSNATYFHFSFLPDYTCLHKESCFVQFSSDFTFYSRRFIISCLHGRRTFLRSMRLSHHARPLHYKVGLHFCTRFYDPSMVCFCYSSYSNLLLYQL